MSAEKWIIKLFEKAGEIGVTVNLLRMLEEKFVKLNWDQFIVSFKDAFICVILTKSQLHCTYINNIIKYAANGVIKVGELSSKDGRIGMCLLTEMMRLCRTFVVSNEKLVRWRICLFLNNLLNSLETGIVLPVELFDVATTLLLERLKDKKPEIRVQAAHALHWLQMPDNPKCPIIESFLFHMTCNSSADVRTAIVHNVAMIGSAVDKMLKYSILDVSDSVRKEVYNRFLTYPFLSLSHKQSKTILEKGLEDTNNYIAQLVKTQLIDKWLDECNQNVLLFLKRLGLENELVCEKALTIIFENFYDSQILDLINDYLDSNTRMIDYDKLCAENIFLWKCVAKYLTVEKKIELARNQGHVGDDYIDVLLPDLVKFSDYIREYYFKYDQEDKEFILTQLLVMAREFTIDDVGSTSLNKLCFDLILDDRTTVKPIKPIALLLDITFKNGKDILNYVKLILNEIQSKTIDVYPFIEKLGNMILFEEQLKYKANAIEELSKTDSPDLRKLNQLKLQMKKIKKQYQSIHILPEEKLLANKATNNLLKSFDLVYRIQQLTKVGVELSLLTDIIENIVVGYLQCSLVSIRVEAIRAISPYMLNNNVNAAKEFLSTALCSEVSNHFTNRHLMFQIMFEVLLCYDFKKLGLNDDLDTNKDYEDFFSIEDMLPLLVECIDYDVDDNSFKSVLVKGFCDLLTFQKVKSINLISKLLIIWFRPLTHETFNLYSNLVQFFTTYVFYIRTSSSTLAKCYVPVLREIANHNLSKSLFIRVDEVNSTLINLIRGLIYKNESTAINAHGELAGYIFDYLLEEDQSYTPMLVDTLFKLEINFDYDNELITTLGPKLMRVIKHFKSVNDKNSAKYLKKIRSKFDPVIQKKASFIKKEVETMEVEIASQVPSMCTEKLDPIENAHGDLFSQVNLIMEQQSSDDEDSEDAFTKLDEMKRLSEVFKKSITRGEAVSIVELNSED
ncbi:condensin complex subunit 3 [Sipha flava]|jgi:condensin complex subunit 3|uniref:Condensin complex subunit 3 n=1 Tax=Sipha flava TaxID=143950 RepID=A0A2S2R455_9HEMI|nr:condensin complex subunit 3 [Sipha flava]